MKFSYILLALCLLILVFPVSAVGTAQLGWYNDTEGGGCVTAVDTNDDGTLVIAGYWNGNITAYNIVVNVSNSSASATVAWRNSTYPGPFTSNNTIKKIVADENGNIAWISERKAGYISSSGAVGSQISSTQNFSDVALRADAGAYAVTQLRSGTTSSRVTIYTTGGAIYAQNTSFGTNVNWTRVGYDPNNLWIITSNASSNRLYYWNVTAWSGWSQFNPLNTAVKNTSQIFIDSFPYRTNLTVNSVTEKGIWFYNASNTTYITQINNSHYFANFANIGRYFWWTTPGNMSNASNWSERPQNELLNMSSGDGTVYLATVRPGYTNYTIYFGNKTFSNQFVNQSWTNNGTLFIQNITASTSWTPPTGGGGVRAVNVSLIGGGGAGATGDGTYAGDGSGGSAGTLSSYKVYMTPGYSSYSVGIGQGGYLIPYVGYQPSTASTFDNGTVWSGAGGAQGVGTSGTPGAAGNTTIAGYPTAAGGGTGRGPGWSCAYSCNDNPGTAGGVGFAAGAGGGGNYYKGTCSCSVPGYGGAGAPGVVQISYYVDSVPIYYYGVSPSSSSIGVIQSRDTSTALNQSSIHDYVGNIVDLDVPSTGALASISTETIFYQQYILSSGFDTFWCATYPLGGAYISPGTVHDTEASNGGSASISARGNYANVYDAGAVLRASLLTGGIIQSVDSAMSSGLFAAFGGDSGILYMFSKEGSSTWYTYYTGGIASPIKSVATGWNGECVVVGRGDGRFEYYITNISITPTPTPSYVDAQVRVFKDSAGYANQPVTVYSSTTYNPYVWVPAGTSYTDGGGVFTYTTTVGTYYKFVVNNVPGTTNGEGEVIWQSNTVSTIVQIFIISASTPYEWNAYYNTASNNVTVVYSDTVTPTSVIVSIKDLKTNLVVLTRTYLSTPSFTLEYHDQLGNGTYQVSIIINRLGGSVRDQRTVMSPNTYGTILPNDQYITWAISTFVLMLIAGMFSYSNSKRGALAVVVVAVIMMIFKLLPWGLMTVAMLAAIFAVMSLFASRVQ